MLSLTKTKTCPIPKQLFLSKKQVKKIAFLNKRKLKKLMSKLDPVYKIDLYIQLETFKGCRSEDFLTIDFRDYKKIRKVS